MRGYAGETSGQGIKGVGDVLGLSETAQGNLLLHCLDGFLGYGTHHIGIRDTQCDSIDTDASGTQFTSQRQGKAIDSKVRGGVGNTAGLSINTYHRGGVQDNAAVLFAHLFYHSLGAMIDTLEVQIHDLDKSLISIFVERGAVGDTCIVDENINAAVFLQRLRSEMFLR